MEIQQWIQYFKHEWRFLKRNMAPIQKDKSLNYSHEAVMIFMCN